MNKSEQHFLGFLHYFALFTYTKCLSIFFFYSSWKFVSLSLECLLCLKDNLREQSEESEKMLSVAHQRSIRTLLDRVITVGLLPNLLPGVDPLPLSTEPATSTLSDFEVIRYVF